MSTINTNIPSLVAQRNLRRSQLGLAVSLQRLASGLKINRGADDPAGLIVSERLRSEVSASQQAIRNSHRAINVIATTEGALDEVSALMTDIQAKLVEAANRGAFSDEEVEANQLQIDSAIDSIARIANTSTFAGRKLLDGSLDYLSSGVDWTMMASVNVLGAKFGTRDFIPVEVDVSTSAQKAQLTFAASSPSQAVVIDLQGRDGIVTLSFPASATSVDIIDAINAERDATGVTASAAGYTGVPPVASGVVIQSIGYGSNNFVSVQEVGVPTGAFTVQNRLGVADSYETGIDAEGTINGAPTIGDGLTLKLNSSLLDIAVTVDETFGAQSTEFAITAGGALFQLGPEVNTNQQENIGVKSMQPNKLGNRVVGFLSDLQSGQRFDLRSGNFKEASDVIQEVITQVSFLRGRLGAFERNTLQTNINQLEITTENLVSSESVIRDTDFAVETSNLTRSQILVQAGNSVLA
ncbi:MAG: flagellin N-terminal helical domain-containing protein, partial [Planctomycetota bacterium]